MLIFMKSSILPADFSQFLGGIIKGSLALATSSLHECSDQIDGFDQAYWLRHSRLEVDDVTSKLQPAPYGI